MLRICFFMTLKFSHPHTKPYLQQYERSRGYMKTRYRNALFEPTIGRSVLVVFPVLERSVGSAQFAFAPRHVHVRYVRLCTWRVYVAKNVYVSVVFKTRLRCAIGRQVGAPVFRGLSAFRPENPSRSNFTTLLSRRSFINKNETF